MVTRQEPCHTVAHSHRRGGAVPGRRTRIASAGIPRTQGLQDLLSTAGGDTADLDPAGLDEKNARTLIAFDEECFVFREGFLAKTALHHFDLRSR